MSDFKIESNIPIPESEPDELEIEDLPPPEEDSRWVPFKPNQRKCANNKHTPMIGRCTKCGDIFPCPSGKCGHADCKDPSLSGLDCPGNGTDLPEWITEAREPVAPAPESCEAGVSHEETP